MPTSSNTNDSKRHRRLSAEAVPATPAAALSRCVVIQNPEGLHLRPASLIAGAARKTKAKVMLVFGDKRVDARNAMDLLTLAAAQGSEITVETEGPGAAEVLEQVAVLLAAPAPSE